MGVPVYRTASTVPQYTDISVYRYTPVCECFFLNTTYKWKQIALNPISIFSNDTHMRGDTDKRNFIEKKGGTLL